MSGNGLPNKLIPLTGTSNKKPSLMEDVWGEGKSWHTGYPEVGPALKKGRSGSLTDDMT